MNYNGLFRGRVADVNDPEKKGRVRVEIPVLGPASDEEAAFTTLWSPVNLPGHAHDVPDIGEMVRVSFGAFTNNAADAVVAGVETRERFDGTPLIPCPSRGEEDFPADLGTNTTTRTTATGETVAFTNAAGEQVTFKEPQSQFDPTTAYARCSSKERSGLRWEFDPASGRMRAQAPSGSQVELANGINAKANFINLSTNGNYQRFVHGDDIKDVQRGRFIRAKTEKTQLSSRDTTVTRDKLTADTYEEAIRIQRKSTVNGIRQDTTHLKHIVAAGLEYNFSTLKEVRTIGGFSQETICGALSGTVAIIGVPGVTPAKRTWVLNGNIMEFLFAGNRDVMVMPTYRMRIGYGDPITGLVLNPPPALSPNVVPGAEAQFQPIKGLFATNLLAYFTTVSAAFKTMLGTISTTGGFCTAAASAVGSLVATNPELAASTAGLGTIAAGFTNLAVAFSAMEAQIAAAQGGFDAYIAQYGTEMGLTATFNSTWFSNCLVVY